MSESDTVAASALVGSVSSTLLQLLNKFPSSLYPPNTSITSLSALSDGLCLFHFLHSLEPSHFDLEPLQTGDNLSTDSSIRQANLQYLLDCLETFFEENMNKNMDLSFLDTNALANPAKGAEEDNSALCNLLELTLLCAINSSRKEDVIHEIMTMDDNQQQTLMNVIHEIQNRVDKDSGSSSTSASASSGTASVDLGIGVETGSTGGRSAAEFQELEKEKYELAKSLDTANRDLKEWKRRAKEFEDKFDSLSKSTDEQKSLSVQATSESERINAEKWKNEQLRLTKELARFENRVGELEQMNKTSSENLLAAQRENNRLTDMVEEKNQEVHALTDELHLAREKMEQSSAFEKKYDKMRERLQEMDELKLSNQSLEQENSKQLDRIIELENEAKEIDALKLSLNRMKDQSFAAENALLDKTLIEENLNRSLAESKELITNLRNDQKNLEMELKQAKNDLETVSSKLRSSGKGSLGGDLTDDSESSGGDGDAKLTIKRLEYEIKQLKAAAGSGGGSSEEFSLLKAQKESLQEKYLESQRKNSTLLSEMEKKLQENEKLLEKKSKELETKKQEIDDLTQKQEDANGEDQKKKDEEIAGLKSELIALHEQLENLRADKPKAASPAADGAAAAPGAPGTAPDIESLLTRNKKLEAYIKQMQKKQKLLEEAQEKQGAQLSQTHEAYKQARQQLIDRERELVDREKLRQLDNNNATRERKLLSSAFYSMGMEFQAAIMTGRAIHKNTSAAPAGRSWLSQQRMAAANQQ